MTRLTGVFLTVVTLLFVLPPRAAAQEPIPLFAYYYIWFDKGSWDRAKSDRPALGAYSSDDSRIMREHITQAKDAGITGFIVSWKSTPSLDRRLQTLVNVARSEDFRLAIIYEGLDFDRNPLPVDKVAADLALFRTRHGSDPVFGLFGKPVVIWSGSWKYSADQIHQAALPVRDKVLVLGSEKSVEDYERIADVVDGNAYYWSSADPQRDTKAAEKLAALSAAVHRHRGLWIAPFAPGFDARLLGGTRVVERHDGATLRRLYDTALTSSPDVLGLISWNEFSENSHVEPSTNHGDRYLTVLRELSANPVGELSPLAEDSSAAGESGPSGALVLGICGGGALLALTVFLLLRKRTRIAVIGLTGVVTASCMVGTLSSDSAGGRGAQAVRPNPGPPTQYHLGPKPVRSAEAVTIAAAGDIACPPDAAALSKEEREQPRPCRDHVTADLVASLAPDAVLTLGDHQYPNGSLERFQLGYDRTWGRFKDITYPVVGNHEYGTSGARGYFDYFGAAAGDRDAGYYSYDLGAWHVVALNSECERIGGCGGGSPQELWLRADLAAHPATCTLTYLHRPRFSSGTHGSNTDFDAIWRALHDAGVDVLLTAHDHNYERFAPLSPGGSADERGVRQFVVGTGGNSHYRIRTPATGSESRIQGVYGVLSMTLRPDGYDWRFVAEPGAQAADSGSGRCSGT